MKKKSVLVFGLIAAFLVVSLNTSMAFAAKPLGFGCSGGVLIIQPNNHVQCFSSNSPVCWADEEGCDYCCNQGYMFYECINDLYGCDCCEPPLLP